MHRGKRGNGFGETRKHQPHTEEGFVVSTGLSRIAQRAKDYPKERFTSLSHHLNAEFLCETWGALNKQGAVGVDRVTATAYAEHLEANLENLANRLKEHRYHAPNVRRVYIPKPGQPNKLRPLGIPSLEDRLLQSATAQIIGAVYEADFLPCSYGFRPGRNPHQAIARVRTALLTESYQWVYEADIRGFFDHLNHDWLIRMLELRIGDPWMIRLIKKWLKAGIQENDGQVRRSTEGSPQGGPISPTLANIYLHYVLDLWFTKAFLPTCRGKVELIRFADDFLMLAEFQQDAIRFDRALRKRLEKFGLEVAEEKTRIIPYGREAWRKGCKDHFDFLGFRHYLGTSKRGKMVVIRHPSPKSIKKFLGRVKDWLSQHQHSHHEVQRKQLTAMVRGFNQYFGLYHCSRKLHGVTREVFRYWHLALRRQSQRSKQTWETWNRKPWFRLPTAKLVHPNV